MEISARDLKEKLAQGQDILLIDVREQWEYEEENVGAQCIPLGELPHKLDVLKAYKEKQICVHCKSGSRSNQAMKFLESKGFKNVMSLAGGIEALQDIKII